MSDVPDWTDIAKLQYAMFVGYVSAGFSEFQALRLIALQMAAQEAFSKGMPTQND